MSTTDTYSGFLSLPTELRCNIYDFLLADPHAITISAGYITCFGNRIQDRARKTEIPGLPLDLAPLARRHHDTCLLSVAKPPTIAVDNGTMEDIEGEKLGLPAPLALLLTSKLVNDELTDYMRKRRIFAQTRPTDAGGTSQDVEEDTEGLSLYVSYPYGVLVLKSLYPFLLKQARRVYISGYYTALEEARSSSTYDNDDEEDERLTPSSSFAAPSFNTPASGPGLRSSSRTARNPVSAHSSSRPRLRLDPRTRPTSHTAAVFPPFCSTYATSALSSLIHTILPQDPTLLIKIEARILYTGDNSYGHVWSNEDSPVCHILRSIYGGNISMKVKRGALGTGVLLEAKPKTDGRSVSTSWETWKATPSRGGNPRTLAGMSGRMGVRYLDSFLTGKEVEKEKVDV
jgi:hypothetical protein